jgi:hypothetical protein
MSSIKSSPIPYSPYMSYRYFVRQSETLCRLTKPSLMFFATRRHHYSCKSKSPRHLSSCRVCNSLADAMGCFHLCCGCDRDSDVENDQRNSHQEAGAVTSRILDRSYQVAAEGDDATADLDTDDESPQGFRQDGSSAMPKAEGELHMSIREFFRSLRARWNKYDSLESLPAYDPLNGSSPVKSLSVRPALSFDSSKKGILSISSEEVVLPGSDLQRQMSMLMAKQLELQGDECVICMETFDPTNPRMPTHCGCGVNKTYFHLPCLFQWIEQCPNCPSCAKKLQWEEL